MYNVILKNIKKLILKWFHNLKEKMYNQINYMKTKLLMGRNEGCEEVKKV